MIRIAVYDPPGGSFDVAQTTPNRIGDVVGDRSYLEIPNNISAKTHYIVDNEIVDRPVLPSVPSEIAEGATLTITGLPEGTQWFIYDTTDPALPKVLAASGAVGASGELSEVMEEKGTYELEMAPPWPTQPRTEQIEVTDGP